MDDLSPSGALTSADESAADAADSDNALDNFVDDRDDDESKPRGPAGREQIAFVASGEIVEWLDQLAESDRFDSRSHVLRYLLQEERRTGAHIPSNTSDVQSADAELDRAEDALKAIRGLLDDEDSIQ